MTTPLIPRSLAAARLASHSTTAPAWCRLAHQGTRRRLSLSATRASSAPRSVILPTTLPPSRTLLPAATPSQRRRYASRGPGASSGEVDVSNFASLPPISFSIIAHVDHGKSTLADRLLELTGTIPSGGTDGPNKQVLDKLKVERERGITVKSQAVSMRWAYKGRDWLLNLIDTPGHVDFSFEVGRSLSACQTALLVVDATQGVQSQTLSVFRIARARGLRIIPVLNKIDLPASDVDRCLVQLEDDLGLDVRPGGREEPIEISAKTGQGVDKVLQALVERAGGAMQGMSDEETAQRGEEEDMRSLVFDSWYDSYKGVVALISVREGVIRKGDRIASCHSSKKYDVLDVGVNSPGPESTGVLRKGQVGWMICNMKDMSEASIGDTLHHASTSVAPLEGFKPTTPMVYAAAFPLETTDFLKLEDAINRLALNDRSVTVQRESSAALGQGCRLGFLGTLHLDVFRQRLEDEYGQRILVTAPTVPYRILYKDGTERICSNPSDFPTDEELRSRVETLEEPMVRGILTCPEEHVGAMMELCAEHRGEELDVVFGAGGTDSLVRMDYQLPLAEIVTDFFSKLKSRSSGFASFEYEEDGYLASDLVRLSFLISGSPVDALAMILHRTKAVFTGRAFAKKLKDVIPRQQFEVAIQALVGGKVVARESLSAYRKDVTAGLYGGHYERKLKHLNKQKEGKKRLKAMGFGRIQVPQEAFLTVLDSRPKAK